MAKGRKLDFSWLTPKGSVGEAKRNAENDRREREAAEKDLKKTVILRPDEVRGEYDAFRALKTTLGGKADYITQKDLVAFRENMRTVQSRLSDAGITAAQVLEFAKSMPLVSRKIVRKGDSKETVVEESTDLSRASDIRVAVPTFAVKTATQQGPALDIRFVTSAGPGSRVSRHHVLVRFFGFAREVRALQAVPKTPDGKKEKGATTLPAAVKRVQGGYLAFDCDCERHRYVYRYISTIGGFNAGRAETGYPKITNPKLYGMACKHVLRAMGEVNSSRQVGKLIGDALTRAVNKPEGMIQVQVKQAEARAQAAKQHKRPRDLEKLVQKAAEVSRRPPPQTPGLKRFRSKVEAGNIDEALAMLPFLNERERDMLRHALGKAK